MLGAVKIVRPMGLRIDCGSVLTAAARRRRWPTVEDPPVASEAFPLVGAAEDAGFEPARACTQHAFQVCPRPFVDVQTRPPGGHCRRGNRS